MHGVDTGDSMLKGLYSNVAAKDDDIMAKCNGNGVRALLWLGQPG